MNAVDVLVVGAGPAGCCAAREAAAAGASVLLIEHRRVVGHPVQCAEYVPAQIVGHVAISDAAIAQRVRHLRTYLPDGEMAETRAAGYVLHRAAFDKGLATAARRAGAEIRTGVRAVGRTRSGVRVLERGLLAEVDCAVVVGADGPRSTVRKWMGLTEAVPIDALQVEAVLTEPRDGTEVYFDPLYAGGYGWLFPKGDTANVGVGVNRALGGDPASALDHLLARLNISQGDIVGRTGGPIPSDGTVGQFVQGGDVLVGDAAGHTHPVTGAGILSAVVGGAIAGRAAAAAALNGDLSLLSQYEAEWDSYMGGPMRHALARRKELDRRWSTDPLALSAALRENWIAFRAYSRRRP